MNPPENNDDAQQFRQRLSQFTGRQPGPLNVPQRQTGPLHDIDDSAFQIEDIKPAQKPLPANNSSTPSASMNPQQPPAPVAQPPSPAATPALPPQPAAPPASHAQPPVPPPSHPAPARPALPPMPVTPVEPPPQPSPPPEDNAKPVSFSPTQHNGQQPTAANAYQPQMPHIPREITERIDETPQQNSKDIESLITHTHRVRRLKGFFSFLAFVAAVILAAFVINQYIFQSYYVEGSSMEPTLSNDDRLIIDKFSRTLAGIQGHTYVPARGQIVVLDSAIMGPGGREEQLIKRVIGVPGDTVSISEDGKVTVTNQANPDGFSVAQQLGLHLQPTHTDGPREWVVRENQIFVMGDNRARNGSYDSRAFGTVEAERVVGRLWLRILPLDKAQAF